MPAEQSPLERLREVATTMRMALDGALQAAQRPADPTGTCALAAILVRDAVTRLTPYRAVVRGGAGELHEGALAQDGSWQGHYWVEVDPGEGPGVVVVDITADQFGWPAPVCELLANVAARYRSGDQAEVEGHMDAAYEWVKKG